MPGVGLGSTRMGDLAPPDSREVQGWDRSAALACPSEHCQVGTLLAQECHEILRYLRPGSGGILEKRREND